MIRVEKQKYTTQSEQLTAVLDQLQLGRMERRVAESYLRGETGKETLRGLSFRDMTRVSSGTKNLIFKLMESYGIKKQYEEAGRFFNFLYALSACTCGECIHIDYRFIDAVKEGNLQIDLSQVLAVCSYRRVPRRGFTGEIGYLHAFDLESLGKGVDYNIQVVRRALREFRGNFWDVKIILYTLYFYLRSSRVDLKAGESPWDCPEILRGRNHVCVYTTKRDANKRKADYMDNMDPSCLDSTDEALLREYEDIMVGALGQIFKPDASRDMAFRDMQRRIRLGELPGSQLARFRGRPINETIFVLICSSAYVNYRVSGQLHSIMTVCGAAAPEEVLYIIHAMKGFAGIDDELDDLFGIPGRNSINWVIEWIKEGFAHRTMVDMDAANALFRSQLQKYPALYLDIYRKTDYFVAYDMERVIKEQDPDTYWREALSQKAGRKNQVLDFLMKNGMRLWETRDYLEGRMELSALYTLKGQLGGEHKNAYNARKALELYDQTYHEEDFYVRSLAYMALRGVGGFFGYERFEEDMPRQEMLRRSFRCLTQAGVGLADQLEVAYMMVADAYGEEDKQRITQDCISVFQQYLAERTGETMDAFTAEGAYGRYIALLVYSQEARLEITEENREVCAAVAREYAKGKDAWMEQILSYSLDNSRMVRRELERILIERPGWRPQITEMLFAPRVAQREMAILVLSRWNAPQDRAALWRLQEREKNDRIRSLLEEVLDRADEEVPNQVSQDVLNQSDEKAHDQTNREAEAQKNHTGGVSRAVERKELVKELHKGGRKRNLAWAYKSPFSPVHRSNGGIAPEEYLQALLLCYSSTVKHGLSPDAALLAEGLSAQELAVYVDELYDKWLAAGGEVKKKWVLYAAAIHGGENTAEKLQRQIRQWSQDGRDSLVRDAVQALALSPQSQAHIFVESLARESQSEEIREAANQALKFAADQY